MKTATPARTFWENRITRKIRGVTVSFYQRFPGSCYTMDFKVNKQRVRALTHAPVMQDAEVVAAREIQKRQEALNGIAAAKMEKARRGQRVATVAEIESAMAAGDKMCEAGTARAYLSSLRRLAAVVNENRPDAVSLADALTLENLLRFYSRGQGDERGRVNRVDKLACNCGLNTCIRNVRSLFTRDMISAKFQGLKLPDLQALRELFYLPEEDAGFDPWDPAVYDAMEAASAKLRELRCDGGLRPGLLVRAVYAEPGAPWRELGDKPGVLMELQADTALVEWVIDGERVRHVLPWRQVRAVNVDYAELWLVNAMFRRLGLRSVELLAARAEWIEQRPDRKTGELQWVLALRDREDFKVRKHGAPRNLVLDDELLRILRARSGFLVAPDLKPEMRKELVERLHNTWLRQFIPARAKGNHELRMWAGSIVYMRDGLAAAAYFLGHKSQVTTERFYATWFSSAPALDGAAVSLSHVATAA